MENKKSLSLTVSGILILLAVLVVAVTAFLKSKNLLVPGGKTKGEVPVVAVPFGKFEKFASDAEFTEYLQNSGQAGGGLLYSMGTSMRAEKSTDAVGSQLNNTMGALPAAGGASSERVSGTNTQVFGIDEPDIVKTDGENLFYSLPFRYYLSPEQPVPMMNIEGDTQTMMEKRSPDYMPRPPVEKQGGIVSVKVFPPASMSKQGTVPQNGDLLLARNMLLVFSDGANGKTGLYAYDVSKPGSPVEKWKIVYKQNSFKVDARLYQNKVYLVTRTYAAVEKPCPLQPFDMTGVSISCTQIYRPAVTTQSDSVYTVSRIDAATGKVEENLSFVGSENEAQVYMSKEALYVAYHYSGDMVKIFYAFAASNSDLFPSWVIDKLSKLQGYDISQVSKMTELGMIVQRMSQGMDNDKQLAFQNNVENRMKKFVELHSREFERTGIVKVDAGSFRIDATGDVPGRVLNQFALDEYKGNLRVATTVGENIWIGGFGTGRNSFSDVYVLNGSLRTVGSVTNLGKGERIYAVRFIADKGYVVTFRQTDPLYVLDLANAGNPALKGELKIPGYSAYLHPLTEDLLVGVGKEDNNVKISLFNVRDAANPVEVDTYRMNEYWSDILNTHHAFLADEKHEAFFMPGSRGGYVFSYKNNKLDMVRAVSDTQAQRAVYINNYLYIVGQQKITVLDENNWDKVGELEL